MRKLPEEARRRTRRWPPLEQLAAVQGRNTRTCCAPGAAPAPRRRGAGKQVPAHTCPLLPPAVLGLRRGGTRGLRRPACAPLPAGSPGNRPLTQNWGNRLADRGRATRGVRFATPRQWRASGESAAADLGVAQRIERTLKGRRGERHIYPDIPFAPRRSLLSRPAALQPLKGAGSQPRTELN